MLPYVSKNRLIFWLPFPVKGWSERDGYSARRLPPAAAYGGFAPVFRLRRNGRRAGLPPAQSKGPDGASLRRPAR